jgi:hypothetical protein
MVFSAFAGDNWYEDYTNERTLIDAPIDPDPANPKWNNE